MKKHLIALIALHKLQIAIPAHMQFVVRLLTFLVRPWGRLFKVDPEPQALLSLSNIIHLNSGINSPPLAATSFLLMWV